MYPFDGSYPGVYWLYLLHPIILPIPVGKKTTLRSLIFWELYSYMGVVQNVLNVPFLAYKICHVVRMTSSHDYNLYSLRSQLKVKRKSINMVHPPINQTIPNIAI
jgi:hypothetical protein